MLQAKAGKTHLKSTCTVEYFPLNERTVIFRRPNEYQTERSDFGIAERSEFPHNG
jgi:hypothetical protein